MNSYVCKINGDEVARLREYLTDRGWEFFPQDYAYFRASGDKVSLVAYNSGKLTVQGKGTSDFVEFVLEPEILHNFSFNLPTELNIQEAPEVLDLTPHMGIDESGKGDFFGPLAVAAVYIDEESGEALHKIGVKDSKLIKSDVQIAKIAMEIRNLTHGRFAGITLMPETYNRLYQSFGNLNKLLAWGHARVIENLLEKVPECPRALSDKFTSLYLMKSSLMEKGRKIKFEQQVRAESDVAVAAASILARDLFVRGVKQLNELTQLEIPKGANQIVKRRAGEILQKGGVELLNQCVKIHFKTYNEVLNP